MSIKSSCLAKWSSWSLINESHLPACVCVHRSPPPSSVIQDSPCRTRLCSTSTSGQGHRPQQWGWGFHLCSQCVATVQKTKLMRDICTAAGASQELHRPSPVSAVSRTKVWWRVLGETWSDPFGAGAPQRCNALLFTKLKQCFYKRNKKIQFRFTDCVKLLSWWKGSVPAACQLTKLNSLFLRTTRWGWLNKSWYSSSCVWKCLINSKAQNFNAGLSCIDRGLWSHLNILLSVHAKF